MFEDFFTRGKPHKKDFITSDPEFIPVETAAELLSDEQSQLMLNKLRALLTLPKDVPSYEKLCTEVLHNYAEFVQRLPETDLGYYSKPGGLLEHTLERAYLATKKVRKFLLPDADVSETLSHEHALWMYVIFTASLFFQIGYSILKLLVTVYDVSKDKSERWEHFMGAMIARGTHYKYEFEGRNRYLQSRTVTVLLARQLMPVEGFLWISKDRDVFDVWLALLNEDWEQVGSMASFIPWADAETLLKNMYAEELPHELRFINDDPIELDKTRLAAKKFGDVKDGRGFADSHISGRGTQFSAHAENNEAAAKAGEAFLQWLQDAIEHGKISFNKDKSPVHVLRGGVLVSYPVLFNHFLAANPGYGNWNNLLKQVTNLGITAMDTNGSHIRQYKVGTDVVKGMLIKNENFVFKNGTPGATTANVSQFNRPAMPERTPKAKSAQAGASAVAQASMSPDAK